MGIGPSLNLVRVETKESEMKHLSTSNDAANVWMDIHRSRPDEVSQLAYYRFVARRLRENGPSRR